MLPRPVSRIIRTFPKVYCRYQSQAVEIDPKLSKIASEIASLNLLEASVLVKHLKTVLNISESVQPVIQQQAPAAVGSAPAKEEKKENAVQSTFKLMLEKFDPASKAKVIKEIKQLLPGANLVEAKKFVEAAPKMIKDNVPKEEAEKIKKLLEAIGATVTMS